MLSKVSELVASADVFMHVWPLAVPNNARQHDLGLEVELIASHASSGDHFDPSCPACHHLSVRLEAIARTAVERVVSAAQDAITLAIYAPLARIVCPTGNGQRPCVTVSIYAHVRVNGASSNGSSPAIAYLKQVLTALGVREH